MTFAKPLFSIIIPVYNSGQTLNDTLQSIEAQSFDDYELVFVDGVSQDQTLTMISDWKAANPYRTVRIISEPDRGIYDAMNKGIHCSRGQWLYFMGSDDIFASPEVLNNVFLIIQTEVVHLVYGNVTGTSSGTRYTDSMPSQVLSRGIHHQGIFYKREIFIHTGNYNLFFKVAADYHLTLKVFCNKQFHTRYVDITIARFGEQGLSSTLFDYTFFSYHYRFLSRNANDLEIDNREDCLQRSIHCCLQLAIKKKNRRFAWINLLYYITTAKKLNLTFRFKTLLHMLYWTLKNKPANV